MIYPTEYFFKQSEHLGNGNGLAYSQLVCNINIRLTALRTNRFVGLTFACGGAHRKFVLFLIYQLQAYSLFTKFKRL